MYRFWTNKSIDVIILMHRIFNQWPTLHSAQSSHPSSAGPVVCTLLGEGLAEALLGFLAGGGGDPLTERDGEGDAEPGAGLFSGGGCEGGDREREDALLIGWGL